MQKIGMIECVICTQTYKVVFFSLFSLAQTLHTHTSTNVIAVQIHGSVEIMMIVLFIIRIFFYYHRKNSIFIRLKFDWNQMTGREKLLPETVMLAIQQLRITFYVYENYLEKKNVSKWTTQPTFTIFVVVSLCIFHAPLRILIKQYQFHTTIIFYLPMKTTRIRLMYCNKRSHWRGEWILIESKRIDFEWVYVLFYGIRFDLFTTIPNGEKQKNPGNGVHH